MAETPEPVSLLAPPSSTELLNLGAVDGEFYCRQWFPSG